MRSSIWLVVSVLAIPSSATLARGQDVTLGDVVAALQAGAQRGKLDSINPAAKQILDLAAASLTEERVLGLSVTNVGKAINVEVPHIERWFKLIECLLESLSGANVTRAS